MIDNDTISLSDINLEINQVIIFEDQYYTEMSPAVPSNVNFDGEQYELRVVASIIQENNCPRKYIGIIFNRHGGYHSKWWKQMRIVRKKYIPVQIDGGPVILPNSVSIFVYEKKNDCSIKNLGKNLLRYIGGQTHAICGHHNHPLIPVPDRIANCSKCSRKDHY